MMTADPKDTPAPHASPIRRAAPAFAALLWLAAAAALTFGIHPLNRGETIAGPSALSLGVLAGKDTIAHDYPAAWWDWREVRQSGRLPLWNPCWFAGEPFIASQTFLPFYPPNWLMAALPMPLGFNLQYPLHLLLAAVIMAWTCRRRGLGGWAAAAAGLAFGFGGHLATLIGPGHLQKLQALAWMPLVVFGLGRLGGRRPEQGILPLGLGLALQTLAGHPQVVYLSLVAGGLEFLFRISDLGFRIEKTRNNCDFNVLHENPDNQKIQNLQSEIRNPKSKIRDLKSEIRNPKSEILHRLHVILQSVALALLLSSVMWLPTAEFGRLSNRAGALGWADAVRGSLPPEEAFEFALPRLRGDTMPAGRGAYAGRYGESPTSSPERIVSDYAGAATLLLAALGLVLGRGRRRWAAGGWWLLAELGLAISLGGYLNELFHAEVYQSLMRWVPGLSHFRSPSSLMALAAFGLAMAAAVGADELAALARRPAGERRRGATVTLAAAIVVLIVAMILRMQAAGDVIATGAHWERLARRPANAAEALAALRGVALLHGSVFLAAAAALIGGIALALRRQDLRRGPIAAAGLAVLLSVTLTADLTINARPFWNAVDARPYQKFMQDHWAMPEWKTAAERMQGPVRYLEIGGELKNWALTYTDFTQGRVITSLHGYHPVAYGDYFRLLSGLGFTHPNLLRLFAVDWLLLPESSKEAPPPGFSEIRRESGLRLLVNPGNAFVRPAGALREARDWDALLAWLRDPANDPRRTTLYLPGEAAPDARPAGESSGTATAMPSIRYHAFPLGPGEWGIDYAADAPGRIVVSLPAMPGWRAWSQGGGKGFWNPLKIEKAYGYFMLLGPLAAGSSDVILRYDPVSQRLGLYLTLLGLAWLGWRLGRGKVHPTT